MTPIKSDLVDYSRLNHAMAHQTLKPSDAASASVALRQVRDHLEPGTGVTIHGAGRSFGGQALPPARLTNKVLLDTAAMNRVEMLPESDDDKAQNIRRAVVGAGVSFKQMLDTLDNDKQQYMPFSTPTSRYITVAGALSGNTHSRTTSARGGYLFDHVQAFTLVTPDLGPVQCHRDAPKGSLERDLFFAAPGSYGALGVVTDIEMALRVVPKTSGVHTATIKVTNGMDDFLDSMERIHAENHAHNTWDEGIFVLLYGSPSKGHATITGSQTATEEQKKHLRAMPMFAESPLTNPYFHGIGNRFPRVAIRMMEREFSAGTEYVNDLRSYSYFLSSHDDAHTQLAAHNPVAGSMRIAGVDPDLPTAHQAWTVPTDKLEGFMRCAGALLDGPFADILPLLEMQDILVLPRSQALMSPCKDERQWLFQYSFVAHDKGGPMTTRIREFFRLLSVSVSRPEVDAKVYLLKESQCDDALLRRMHEPALTRLRELKAQTDSRGLLTSELLDRLDLHENDRSTD